ncbi:MAG: 3-methyl-2-oxobutanoate hydroxymethyltransferase [Candidatus Melainabacteria bacterium]|jgi:3-methyl-2-oxobutanoate hydroxymethyltransferase
MNKTIQASNLVELKKQGEKLVCLTAYDFPTAKILDEAGIDMILVGDSLANVFLGLDNTYEIGMTEMLYHLRAVSRGVKRALLAVDMPFLSYQVSIKEAVKNAAEFYRAGAQAVKLEGASELTLEIVEKLTEIGIPVIGHLGYTPQSAGTIGKGKIQGKTDSSAKNIFEQARKLEEAGAIAIVLEMIPADLASQITKSLKIPTIGIGAGLDCDGQILVSDDIFGMTEKKLSFVKRYAEIGKEMNKAAMDFAQEVRDKKFP